MTTLRLVGSPPGHVVHRLRAAWPGPVFGGDDDAPDPCEVVLAWDPYRTEHLLDVLTAQRRWAGPRPWWLHTRAAGVDHRVLCALEGQELVYTKGSGAHGVAVAEHVLAVLLSMCRRLPELSAAAAACRWAVPPNLRELSGTTASVVGLGDIGRTTARLLTAFGTHVIGVRRTSAPSSECAEVLPVARLADALRRSSILVVCAPLTSRTRGLVGPAQLAAMPTGGLLVNVGRGPVVDTGAVVRALRSGRLAGAALDVFDIEPLPTDSPLWTELGLVITPHCADATPATDDRALRGFLANARRRAADSRLAGLVDRAHGY